MPIYMQYEGIKGAVTEAGHKEWIELESCQFGSSRHITIAVGRGTNRDASAPSISEVVVTKYQDCASADLIKAAVGGEGKTVKIDFCKTDKEKLEVYLNLELANTLVSSFQSSGAGGTNHDRPMESLSLNFTKITYKAIFTDSANKAGKNYTAAYDLAIGKVS